ncbi:menin-like isoform X2 [Rhopilema esculentum]|uniref:menin-like isoform X2 n=1 Tax=Rhopilema esculentum TaxID=499914 RepID=UPI0031CFBEB2
MAVPEKLHYLLELKYFFPLKDFESVAKLFKNELESPDPNLAILSLVFGFMEHHLTDKSLLKKNAILDDRRQGTSDEGFPVLEFAVLYSMYETYLKLIDQKFGIVLEADRTFLCDTDASTKAAFSTREKVKAVADFVWSQLSTSYFKDRPHIQSIYSFLNGKRLDCFGVALLVVATAQCIGYNDIHLVLSEDHAWISFGAGNKETAEVTWHGKRDGVKRGSPISQDSLVGFSKDWLYLGGNGMQCDRFMEVAAVVSAMNPGIDAKTDSEKLSTLQQDLLWLLFNGGHLDKYPMAICNLADLEEIKATRKSPTLEELYEKAIGIAELEYDGCHVYPYTYYGGYLFRKELYSKATICWKNAALVAARYTHSREDEELYKEFSEIANTFFPEIVKYCRNLKTKSNSDAPESEYFASEENLTNIIKFFDGICLWEEGGSTTVVHAEWAKNFLKLLNSFSFEIRTLCLKSSLEGGSNPEELSSRGLLILQSEKMKLMQESLCQEKINTSVINLHLTSRVGLVADGKLNAKRGSGKFSAALLSQYSIVFIRELECFAEVQNKRGKAKNRYILYVVF